MGCRSHVFPYGSLHGLQWDNLFRCDLYRLQRNLCSWSTSFPSYFTDFAVVEWFFNPLFPLTPLSQLLYWLLFFLILHVIVSFMGTACRRVLQLALQVIDVLIVLKSWKLSLSLNQALTYIDFQKMAFLGFLLFEKVILQGQEIIVCSKSPLSEQSKTKALGIISKFICSVTL